MGRLGGHRYGHACRLVMTTLAFSTFAGCMLGMPEEQRRQLNQAAQYYQQRQPSPAVGELNKIIQASCNTPEAAEAFYLRGLCLSQLNQMQPAALDFREAIQRSTMRTDDLAARARASLAMIHYRWDNWDQAATLYRQSINQLSNRSPTDMILFYAGNALQRAGCWDDARLAYCRILTAFPNQPIAREARAKYYWRYNYFSIQVGTFGDADRAETALHQFAARGLDVWQEYRQGTNPARWVILTGRYANYGDALVALPYVRKFKADAYVVP